MRMFRLVVVLVIMGMVLVMRVFVLFKLMFVMVSHKIIRYQLFGCWALRSADIFLVIKLYHSGGRLQIS